MLREMLALGLLAEWCVSCQETWRRAAGDIRLITAAASTSILPVRHSGAFSAQTPVPVKEDQVAVLAFASVMWGWSSTFLKRLVGEPALVSPPRSPSSVSYTATWNGSRSCFSTSPSSK